MHRIVDFVIKPIFEFILITLVHPLQGMPLWLKQIISVVVFGNRREIQYNQQQEPGNENDTTTTKQHQSFSSLLSCFLSFFLTSNDEHFSSYGVRDQENSVIARRHQNHADAGSSSCSEDFRIFTNEPPTPEQSACFVAMCISLSLLVFLGIVHLKFKKYVNEFSSSSR